MKLIDKDALVAEIENLLDKGKYYEEYDCAYRDGNNGALYALKGKLDTLEVKEAVEVEISDNGCAKGLQFIPVWPFTDEYVGGDKVKVIIIRE